jgi:hypothetical protein
MKNIETEIIINAAPNKIWDVLTDFQSYHQWNPFIKSLSGKPIVGNKVVVVLGPPDGKDMTFTPTILEFSENKEFRWLGKLLTKGIFDGEHYFKLVELENQKTKFIHGENFSGILIPLMGKVLEKTKKGFELMNESLKKECEK